MPKFQLGDHVAVKETVGLWCDKESIVTRIEADGTIWLRQIKDNKVTGMIDGNSPRIYLIPQSLENE